MELIEAASANDFKKLSQLVKRRSVVETFGMQALMAASREGHVGCITKLIEADVDTNEMNNDGMTALLYACEGGHLECVQRLIDAGGNDEMRSETIKCFGGAALVVAARNGRTNCLSWLINIGVCVNECDMDGMTPLVAASERGHDNCVALLLDAGADANLKTGGGISLSHTTALISAAERGNLDCVVRLLQAGADVNLKNGMNASPLLSAIYGSHIECIRYLAEEPVIDFNVIGSTDCPAIFEAIKMNQMECLEILLKKERVDVNIRNRKGETIVMYAITCSPVYAAQQIKLILELRQIDINARDPHGKSALVYAVERGNLVCVELLLRVEGVDVNVQYSDIHCQCTMSSPLGAACNNGDAEIGLALLQAGALIGSIPSSVRRSPLMLMASVGNIHYTNSLIEAGLSVLQCDDQNKSALYFAAKNDQLECLDILIKSLSDQAKTSTSIKILFLQTAIKSKIFEKLSIFLDAKMFCWDWYGEYYESALRSLTKFLITNSYAPGQFMLIRSSTMKSTPLHYGFIRNDLGLIKYVLNSLYLTSHDVKHFHRDGKLLHYVNTIGSREVKAIHANLYYSPWRLDVLSFLAVSTSLRCDKKRVDVINNSKLKFLLPQKIQKRLAFQSQYQRLNVNEWDGIPVNDLQLGLRGLSLEDIKPYERIVELKYYHKVHGHFLDYNIHIVHDEGSDSSQEDEYSLRSEENSDNNDGYEDDIDEMQFVNDGTDPLHISFDEDSGN